MPRKKESPETIRRNHYGLRPLTLYFSKEETEMIDCLRGDQEPRDFVISLIEKAGIDGRSK
jgi:hypothetical protein